MYPYELLMGLEMIYQQGTAEWRPQVRDCGGAWNDAAWDFWAVCGCECHFGFLTNVARIPVFQSGPSSRCNY